jgi:hypothetical protein
MIPSGRNRLILPTDLLTAIWSCATTLAWALVMYTLAWT